MLFITQDETNDKNITEQKKRNDFNRNFIMSRVSEINRERIKALYKCIKYLQDNQRQQSFSPCNKPTILMIISQF